MEKALFKCNYVQGSKSLQNVLLLAWVKAKHSVMSMKVRRLAGEGGI
jgi:acetyl-CoA carboxylase carboxyltransferase component